MCIQDAAVLTILAADAVQDIRKKEILLIPTVVGAAAGIVYRAAFSKEILTALILSMIPAAAMLLLALVFENSVGIGDAVTLFAVGAWTQYEEIFCLFMWGLLCACAFGTVLLIKNKRKKEIPFVVCLLAGKVMTMLLN